MSWPRSITRSIPPIRPSVNKSAGVRQMKIGERLTVTDDMGVEYGTVTKVSPGGESFEITWDNDGHTNVSYYFDVDLFEFVNSGQHSRERANATPGNRHA